MEKAKMKRELEEAAAPAIEEGDMKYVDMDGGVDDDLVYAPPEELQSSDSGGLEVSQVELREEQVESKRSERCIYYQNDEGLWKCRKCCWTYQSERVSSDDIQNTKKWLHKPTHYQTVNQQESCFSRETKVNSGTGCTGRQFSSGESSIKLEHEKQLKRDSFSSSSLPSEISPEEDNKNFKFSAYKEIGSGDTRLLHESDREATALDVERVLRKQDTHDLYCPNCKSCFTRRVIIRKRKCRLPYSGDDSNCNILEEGTGSDPISTLVATTSNPSPSTVDTCLDGSAAPTSNNYDQDQEPDVFRCLSCFSIFIPTGNGFKFLGMSGDRRDEDNFQDHPQTPTVKKIWFSTLFQSDRRGTGIAGVETDDTEVLISSNSTRRDGKVSAVHESSSHAQTDFGGEPVKTGAEGSTEDGTNKLSYQKVSLGNPGGQKIFEDQVSMNMNKQTGDASVDEAPSNAIYDDGEIDQSGITISKEGGNKLLSPTSKRSTEYDIHLVGSGELSDSSIRNNKASDAIIVGTCQVEPLAAQRVHDFTDPAETGNLQYLETRIQMDEQRGTSTEGIQGVEIIKSIIYGGLVELITSLGVVSSAAGSDATTLNVFTLGLANLIGGLFIIGHNLLELKNDQKTEASDHNQYHELLGQRRNFVLHAVLGVLSYLTFGLLPPFVYGFSFQKSDNRDLKLVTVAAFSLLGIIILAAGKGYVQRAPRSYVKTVAYYVVTVLMTSGVSYAAGNLIKMFLEKFGVFQSSLVVTLPESLVTEPAWASY